MQVQVNLKAKQKEADEEYCYRLNIVNIDTLVTFHEILVQVCYHIPQEIMRQSHKLIYIYRVLD